MNSVKLLNIANVELLGKRYSQQLCTLCKKKKRKDLTEVEKPAGTQAFNTFLLCFARADN